jgi:hypothetical protein
MISNNSANIGGGIYTSYGATVIIDNNIIMNNTAYDGQYGGGGIKNDVGAKILNNVVINNKAKNNQFGGGGICNTANSTISNNIIADNSADEGAGIHLDFEWASVLTKNHIIRNTAKNYSAIYNGKNIIQNTIAYNKNTDSNNLLNRTIYLNTNPAPIVNNNNIFNNSAFYEVYDSDQQGGTNMDVTKNWWGTTDDAKIQDKIYDWFDDNTLGIVNYSPYLAKPDTAAPVSPPNGVIKTKLSGNQVQLTWNHNPESDIKGYHVYYGGFNGYSFSNKIDVGKDTTYILTEVAITDTIAVTAYDSIYNDTKELASTIVNDNMVNGNESWYSYAIVSAQTEVKSKTINSIKIYPNPTTNAFQLSGIEGVSTVTLSDLSGRLLISKEISSNETVSVSTLPNGIYLATIQSNNTRKTEKLIIQR